MIRRLVFDKFKFIVSKYKQNIRFYEHGEFIYEYNSLLEMDFNTEKDLVILYDNHRCLVKVCLSDPNFFEIMENHIKKCLNA